MVTPRTCTPGGLAVKPVRRNSSSGFSTTWYCSCQSASSLSSGGCSPGLAAWNSISSSSAAPRGCSAASARGTSSGTSSGNVSRWGVNGQHTAQGQEGFRDPHLGRCALPSWPGARRQHRLTPTVAGRGVNRNSTSRSRLRGTKGVCGQHILLVRSHCRARANNVCVISHRVCGNRGHAERAPGMPVPPSSTAAFAA